MVSLDCFISRDKYLILWRNSILLTLRKRGIESQGQLLVSIEEGHRLASHLLCLKPHFPKVLMAHSRRLLLPNKVPTQFRSKANIGLFCFWCSELRIQDKLGLHGDRGSCYSWIYHSLTSAETAGVEASIFKMASLYTWQGIWCSLTYLSFQIVPHPPKDVD